MNFSSIDIQGNIISSDILTKIKDDDIRFQKASDFGLEPNTPLRDEIGIAWSAAQAHWKAFSLRRDRLKDNDTGTSETRQSWMVPFLRELGYDVEIAKSYTINEKSYAISHKASNRDDFPIHIVGINQSLDKRPEFGTRLSPHALVQEFLNNHEHLYAIVSNGKYLRLLRDATRLARLSYLEFNLEQMMEEELYAEFAVLFRVLHASRMPEKEDDGENAIIEFYHQEALSSGTRIRENLSKAVEQSIKLLANGFLKNMANEDLRQRAISGDLKPDEYYLYMLRTVYRMLFLLVIEERNLIYPNERDAELNQKRDIYYKYYSIQRLTKLVESAIYVDPNKTDLWQSLKTNFLLFEKSFYGEKLGIAPLGSGLFAPTALADIPDQQLDNESLLKVLRYLVMFENDNHQLTRVNYADLDVEEFGSVYEGLLEYKPEITYGDESHQLIFSFKKGDDRSSSGSHYTPEELVKPLIKHSLDYIIEDKLKVDASLNKLQKLRLQEKQLLTITVCDVACGSGHILLSAARRIGFELAKIRESMEQNAEVEQPSPPYLRHAVRDVIKHCIYGVDLNPLAVELCKVALWLEAHNPGEPLNFLDHHIKNGNAIVGLAHLDELTNGIATEAFKTLPDDDKNIAADLRKQNDKERKAREKNVQQGQIAKRLAQENIDKVTSQLNDWAQLPEQTPEQIEAKARAYNTITKSPAWYRLKQLADTQIAQFFLPKTKSSDFVTDGQYYQYLINSHAIQNTAISLATGKSYEKKFFHWFLEFPEVFTRGGFDSVLGNPPYLGKTYLSSNYGYYFLTFVKEYYADAGAVDLVVYFVRRYFQIVSHLGFYSFISTNTIAQGKSKQASFDYILNNQGAINHAKTNVKWPGVANVVVSLISLTNQHNVRKYILNEKEVSIISSSLEEFNLNPFELHFDKKLSFEGSKPYGTGFILTEENAHSLVLQDKRNIEVIQPYLNGDDLNNSITQKASRWIINFGDKNLKEASKYSEVFKIVENLVKPEREKQNDERGKKYWWKYLRSRNELYSQIENEEKTLVVSRKSKHVVLSFVDTNQVLSDMLVVFAIFDFAHFSVLQSDFFNHWVWSLSPTLGSGTVSISPSSCFNTFPTPEHFKEDQSLLELGAKLYSKREVTLREIQLGLTKIYNQFHNQYLQLDVASLEANLFQKSYGKETWNLYNHLKIKKEGNVSYEEAVPLIFELRRLHKEMDEAVLAAYGWHEDSEKWGKAIELRHDFYEVDYLPENDRVRYTIHPEARKEVLKRLLLLNHERFEEEAKQGLHKKKDVEAFYKQKGKPIPEGITFSDQKVKVVKKESAKVVSKAKPRQSPLFEEKNLFNQKVSDQVIQKGSSFLLEPIGGTPSWYCIDVKLPGTRTIDSTSNLAQAVLGKKAGDRIDFGNGFKILEVK